MMSFEQWETELSDGISYLFLFLFFAYCNSIYIKIHLHPYLRKIGTHSSWACSIIPRTPVPCWRQSWIHPFGINDPNRNSKYFFTCYASSRHSFASIIHIPGIPLLFVCSLICKALLDHEAKNIWSKKPPLSRRSRTWYIELFLAGLIAGTCSQPWRLQFNATIIGA